MQFSPELRDGVEAGRITLSFRLWQRPQVKIGGQYTTAGVRIEIDSIEMVPFSSVTRADLRRSGEKDLESLRRRAAHAGPIDDDTLVYRTSDYVVAKGHDAIVAAYQASLSGIALVGAAVAAVWAVVAFGLGRAHERMAADGRRA